MPSNYHNNHEVDGQTCQIIYSKSSEESSIEWYLDNNAYASEKNVQIIGNEYSSITAQALIQSTLQTDTYAWREYCIYWDNGVCTQYAYTCDLKSTTNTEYSLKIQDSVPVTQYNNSFTPEFSIIEQYSNTTKGILTKDNSTNILLHFNNSFYQYQAFSYNANFSKKPYYFLALTANRVNSENSRNLIRDNKIFYVNNANDCFIESKDFFTTTDKVCSMNITDQNVSNITPTFFTNNMSLLFKILVFLFVIYLIF